MRSAGADNAQHLDTHKELTLEQALEYIMPDECLEITPKHIRLRKVQLNAHFRNKQRTLQKTK